MRSSWLAAAALAAQGVHASVAAPVVDAHGLAFTDAASFCRFHCGPTHFSQLYRHLAATSQCSPALCGVRELREAGSDQSMASEVQDINVLSCNAVAQGSPTLEFALTASNTSGSPAQLFQDLHEAFFQAYDALMQGTDATYDACQLAFLQDKLLPVVSDQDDVAETAELKPMLVKLWESDDERVCVASVRAYGGLEASGTATPLMTRRGERNASSTVLLTHVNASIAAQLDALECVQSVLELPDILKLMPLARSAQQLGARMAQQATSNVTADDMSAPALEIRLITGSNRSAVLERLQRRSQELFGLVNMFEASAVQPQAIYTRPVADLRAWTNIVALALAESAVEWLDERQELTQNVLRGEQKVLWTHMLSSRRLDAYVPSLVGVDSARDAGIRGNDVVVGITDSGLYLYHDQFDQTDREIFSDVVASARKVVHYKAWANDVDESDSVTCGHGTHVAGILAGSSYSGENPDLGIADAAQIAFMDIGEQSKSCAGQEGCAVTLATPADSSELLQSQMEAGATIFSFSWGTPGSDYSSQARDLDAFIYENPQVLLVVAAGNSGEATTTGKQTISSPSGAKNVISVGASLNSAASFTDFSCPNIFNEHSVASFSSAGPTTDGRLKPDVVAPGMTLISSQSEAPGSTETTAATCSLQGTSQATPVVTGVAVLLFQWLRDGWWKNGVKDATYGMQTVPAALLKALIIHSGDSLEKRLAALSSGVVSCSGLEASAMDVSYPDVYQGYGKPNLTNIVDFSRVINGSSAENGSSTSPPSLYFLPNSTADSEPSVAHEGEVIILFTVPKNVDLRATLVWTDPPGSPQAASQLQHDLDLTVRVRGSSKAFGPVTADEDTGRDALNNVEMVRVSYEQLVAAASEVDTASSANSSTSSKNASSVESTSAIGDDGEIVVEAVIYGHSVLLADAQKFAFVASSSAIGSTSGSAAATSDSDPFWKSWTIGLLVGGVLLVLLFLASCVRWCHSRGRRRRQQRHTPFLGQIGAPTPVYYPAYAGPAPGPAPGPAAERCPYCVFVAPDAVTLVTHVESAHSGGNGVGASRGMAGGGGDFGLVPMVTATATAPEVMTDERERCPHCRYVAPNAVILVNHVQHVHG